MTSRGGIPPARTAAVKDGPSLGMPNQTLYVKNLNEKINKNELKRALYALFSSYGPVLDIVTARKGARGQTMRGQAHIVFRDVQTSTQAIRSLQGSEFLGRELKIAYGKGQSQIVAKLRGTFETSVPVTAVASTDLQKSIFNAPPSSIPARPVETNLPLSNGPHGVKRLREDEEEGSEASDVPMDEDEDDAPMEEDDDDDDDD